MAADDHSKDPKFFVETYVSTRFAEVKAEATPFLREAFGYSMQSPINHPLPRDRERGQPGHTELSIPEVSSSGRAFLRNLVRGSHQAGSGPIRIEKVPVQRSEPYRLSGARPTEHSNAEAGPLTPLAMQPIGGLISETSTDAEKVHRTTRYKQNRDVKRKEESRDYRELCDWVMRWRGLPKRPSKNEVLAWALKYVQAIREPVYGRHRLSKTGNYSEQEVSSSAQKERKRRAATRELFEKLSQYYRLAEDDDESDGERDEEKGHQREQMWDSLSLLREVVEDLKARDPLLGPFID